MSLDLIRDEHDQHEADVGADPHVRHWISVIHGQVEKHHSDDPERVDGRMVMGEWEGEWAGSGSEKVMCMRTMSDKNSNMKTDVMGYVWDSESILRSVS